MKTLLSSIMMALLVSIVHAEAHASAQASAGAGSDGAGSVDGSGVGSGMGVSAVGPESTVGTGSSSGYSTQSGNAGGYSSSSGFSTGSASGSGSSFGGSFPGGSFPSGSFPAFGFPFPSFTPLPYYGFNPYSFPVNQAPFAPFHLFDFNAYNQQLQNYIKTAEQQAQQAAANNVKLSPNSPYVSTAAAQGVYGPQGGFGQTFVYPPPKDGPSVTYNSVAPSPPGFNRFGVSSFSSSSFSDNNGDKRGSQFSTVTVDDNGNVTTVVSSDPKNEIV